MTKNKLAIIGAGFGLVMIIGGGVAYSHEQAKLRPVSYRAPVQKIVTNTQAKIPVTITVPTSTPAASATTTTIATSSPIVKPLIPRKPKPAAPSRLSYGDAVAKYGNFRFQFSPTCQSVPNQMATANPVTVMLDNRSNAAQTITILGQKYIINAYDYAIVTIDQKTLPMNVYISCNAQINTAEILLQK